MNCWWVSTASGHVYEADVLNGAQGMFNELSWPTIAGLNDFAGTVFHTARWNHAHDVTGERVGVIWVADCNNYFRHPGSQRIVTQYPRDMGRYRLDTVTPDGHV